MRGDRAGSFDRYAMKIVSENLGHNRITVIAQSYLYTKLKEEKKRACRHASFFFVNFMPRKL